MLTSKAKVFKNGKPNAFFFCVELHLIVISQRESTMSTKSNDNDDFKEKEEVPYRPNPQSMNGTPDLSQLEYLEMKNVLFNCEWRYCKMERKNCYTSLSPDILLAINPYERLPIYGQDVIDEFHEYQKKEEIPSNRPHPLGIAARAYMRMVQRKKNQSVIVCGEAGSGKVYHQMIGSRNVPGIQYEM